jgi:hypothetical protein
MSIDQQDAGAEHSFWGVAVKGQSYRNILYLLLGLPLGTLYFTVLVTGMSVGLSLLVLALVGIPLLIGLWYVIRTLMSFERGLAILLLGVDIAPIPAAPPVSGGLWNRFKALWSDPGTWRGIPYLLLRFPAGIATFTIAVTLTATSLAMAFAPTYMWTSDDLTWADRTFDPFPWSFALVPVGIVFFFVSLHVMNTLAVVCGRWARSSLGDTSSLASKDEDLERIDFTSAIVAQSQREHTHSGSEVGDESSGVTVS